MQYKVIQCRPKEADKMLAALANQGWRVVSQSESTWTIRHCFGLCNEVDSVINYTLARENNQ